MTTDTGSEIAIARAVITPSVSTMIADGRIDAAEIAQLHNACSFSPIFAGIGVDKVTALVEEIIAEIRDKGHQQAIADCAAVLSPALRETALCFACRIALADGRVETAEEKSLILTGQHLEIPIETCEKILEVIGMLQNPPTA